MQIFLTIIAAFVGGISGSITILIIERLRSQKKYLSDFNSINAILIGHLNSLINLKKQFSLPHSVEVNNIRANYLKKISNPPDNSLYIHMKEAGMIIHSFDKEFLVPIEKVSTHAGSNPNALLFIMKAKESINSLEKIIHSKNNLIKEMLNDSRSSNEKMPSYLGLKKNNGQTDDRFYMTCSGLLKENDVALFFVKRSLEELNKMAKKVLPKYLHKKIISFKIEKEEFKDLLPPNNYIEGW